MGINIKTNTRIVKANIKSVTFTTYGTHFPLQYECDAFGIVNVAVPSVPSEVKQYLEGDNTVTAYTVPSNVNKLCNYALSSFPNIATLFIFKFGEMLEMDANALYGLNDLQNIYVPENLIEDYQLEYPDYASKFASLVVDHVLTIPYQGNDELTTTFVNQVLNSLELGTQISCTECIIDEGYTTFEFGALEPIFDGILPNAKITLDNEILFLSNAYGITQNGIFLEVE